MNVSPIRRSWLVATVLPLALVAAACGGPADGAPVGDGDARTAGEVETDAPDDNHTDDVADTDDTDDVADTDDTDDVADTDDTDDTETADSVEVGDQRQVISSPAGDDCSAAGREVALAPAPELPEEVAAQRVLLIDAALRCDGPLLRTAMDESDHFRAAFDDTEVDAIGLWWELEEAGEQPFLRLAQVLATAPGRTQVEDGELYVWPRVTTGAAEHTTDDAWAEAHWLDDPAAAQAQGDGYLDWRAGIFEDGQWRFFVRGD